MCIRDRLVNDPELMERAEIIREKGTNRAKFFRGQVDKYTWVDVGSSYLPGEMTAAYLYAQLEHGQEINGERLKWWNMYHRALEPLEKQGVLRRPCVPEHCAHNAHMYYILLNSLEERTSLIGKLAECGIKAVFHYIPLHSSPAGVRFGRCAGPMPHTDRTSETLLRLPLYYDLGEEGCREVLRAGFGLEEFEE